MMQWQVCMHAHVAMPDLVLVQLAVPVLLLALVLERDDDEADEDVDHEEGDDDDVDEVEDGDGRAMVVHRAVIPRVRVHALVHQPVTTLRFSLSIA